MDTTKRLSHLDLLKFFAISSVVLGHSVEQTTGSDFWTNPIWSVIYAYHMPLFMMLCGFFFGSSLKRSLGEMLRNKSIQLLIPSITMTVLIYGAILLTGFNPAPDIFMPDFTSAINVLWFLKCVFLCYLIAYVSIKLLRNAIIAALITSVLLIILPGGDMVNLNFLLPMFWLGHILKGANSWVERNHKVLLASSAVAFITMLFFWSGTLTIYAVPIAIIDWSAMTIDWPNLSITLYRYALGASGSLMFFLLAPAVARAISRFRLYHTFLAIGRTTLGIYVVQTIVVECGIHLAGIYLTTLQTFAITPILAALGLAICYYCILAIRKNSITRLLFLGEYVKSAPKVLALNKD